jgi:hypothetical protein
MDVEVTQKEQNLRLVAAYRKMNDKDRIVLDIATQKLAEFLRETEQAGVILQRFTQNSGIFEG